MTKSYNKRCAGILAVLIAFSLLSGGCAKAKRIERVSDVGYFFNTVVTITLYDAEEDLMQEIWTACQRYEKLLSKTVEGSDVDRINHSGGEAVAVDPETWAILARAKEISAKSGGAFSITIAPISAMWDFTEGTKRMPSDEERLAALPLVDDSRIELLEDSKVRLPEGMMIDLGGIAKGYIADHIAALVRPRCSGAICNFGGNVYAIGSKPDGSAFRVGVRDPQSESGIKCLLTVRDTSVVTSGIYERWFERDGVIYHHILNPSTGLSSDSDVAGATIIAESSMDADAFATACVVLGSEKAIQLLESLGLPGLIILRDGTILTTQDFPFLANQVFPSK